MQALEPLFSALDKGSILINGFVMAGIILILVGLKNVTANEISKYKERQRNIKRIDEFTAWGIFYIIFGLLITVGAFLTFTNS